MVSAGGFGFAVFEVFDDGFHFEVEDEERILHPFLTVERKDAVDFVAGGAGGLSRLRRVWGLRPVAAGLSGWRRRFGGGIDGRG